MFSLVRPGSFPLGLQPPMARNLTFPESGSLWRTHPEDASVSQSVLIIQEKLLTVPDLIKMDLVENVMEDYQTELLDSVPLVQDNLMSLLCSLNTDLKLENVENMQED